MNKLLLTVLVALTVTGCKTTEPLYYHGQYNKAVYSYFKAEDVTLEEQIQILQQLIQTAAAHSKPVAPGVHAHLGMLYFETGNPDLGRQHLEQEKSLFPESVHFIDFLLNKQKEA